eukprot:SAG22_NODE_457_length_10262_cov_17.627964_1_plen_1543_part_00
MPPPPLLRVPRDELAERFVQIQSPWRGQEVSVGDSLDSRAGAAADDDGDGIVAYVDEEAAAEAEAEAGAEPVPVVDLLNKRRPPQPQVHEGAVAPAASTEAAAAAELPRPLPPQPAAMPTSVPPPEPAPEPRLEPAPWPAPAPAPAPAAPETTDILRSIQEQQTQMTALQETIVFAAAEQSTQHHQLIEDQLSWFRKQQSMQQNYQDEVVNASRRIVQVEESLGRLEALQAHHDSGSNPQTQAGAAGAIAQRVAQAGAAAQEALAAAVAQDPAQDPAHEPAAAAAAADACTPPAAPVQQQQQPPPPQAYGTRTVDPATFAVIDRIQRRAEDALASASTLSVGAGRATSAAAAAAMSDPSDHYRRVRAAMRAVSADADRAREVALSSAPQDPPTITDIDIMMPPSCWPVGAYAAAAAGQTDTELQLDVSRRISAVANGTSVAQFPVQSIGQAPAPPPPPPQSPPPQHQTVSHGAVVASPRGDPKPPSVVSPPASPPTEGRAAERAPTAAVAGGRSKVVSVHRTKSVVTELGREPGGADKIGVVHLCNTEADWGAGFAKAALAGGDARWLLARQCDEDKVRAAVAGPDRGSSEAHHGQQPAWAARKAERLLGQCGSVDVTPKLCVGNLYGQLTARDKPAIHSLSDALAKFLRQNRPKQVHTYKLGCELLAPGAGAAGGRLDWATEVLPMMERLGQRYKCTFIVWEIGKKKKAGGRHAAAAAAAAAAVTPAVSPATLGTERMQIKPMGRTTIRPGPQTFGRAPARGEGPLQRRGPTARRQKTRAAAATAGPRAAAAAQAAAEESAACLHRPAGRGRVLIVDGSIGPAQTDRFGLPPAVHLAPPPRGGQGGGTFPPPDDQRWGGRGEQAAVAANVQGSIAQQVAEHLVHSNELGSGKDLGGTLEQLATSVMREEVAKLFQTNAPPSSEARATGIDRIDNAAGLSTAWAGRVGGGAAAAAADGGGDEPPAAAAAGFDHRVKDLVLGVIGQNPANLEGLPASLLSTGGFVDGYDGPAEAFPNEPFGPCAITSGAAGRWSLVPPSGYVPRPTRPKKQIKPEVIDAAKGLRHRIRLRWAGAALEDWSEHARLMRLMRFIGRKVFWRVQGRLFRQWKIYTFVENATARTKREAVVAAFRTWRLQVGWQKENARREEIALQFLKRLQNMCIHRAFSRWGETVAAAKTARLSAWDLVFSMLREQLRAAWEVWQENCRMVLLLRSLAFRIRNRGLMMALNTWQEARLLSLAEKKHSRQLGETLIDGMIAEFGAEALAQARAEAQPPPPPELSREININVNWAELLGGAGPLQQPPRPSIGTPRLPQRRKSVGEIDPSVGPGTAAGGDDDGDGPRYAPSNAAELQSDSDYSPRRRRHKSNARLLQSDSDYSEEEYDGAGNQRFRQHGRGGPHGRPGAVPGGGGGGGGSGGYHPGWGVPPPPWAGGPADAAAAAAAASRPPWRPVDKGFYDDGRVQNRSAVRAFLHEQRDLSGDEGSLPSTEWGSEEEFAFIGSAPNADLVDFNFDATVDGAAAAGTSNAAAWGDDSDLSEGEIPR